MVCEANAIPISLQKLHFTSIVSTVRNSIQDIVVPTTLSLELLKQFWQAAAPIVLIYGAPGALAAFVIASPSTFVLQLGQIHPIPISLSNDAVTIPKDNRFLPLLIDFGDFNSPAPWPDDVIHTSSKENSDTGWAFAAAARVSHVFSYIKLPTHTFETCIHRFPTSIPPSLLADMQICSLPRLFPAGSSLAGLVLSLLINCPRLHIDGDSSLTTLTNSILAPVACALFHTDLSGLSNLATIATIETLINTHFDVISPPGTQCLIIDLAVQDLSLIHI